MGEAKYKKKRLKKEECNVESNIVKKIEAIKAKSAFKQAKKQQTENNSNNEFNNARQLPKLEKSKKNLKKVTEKFVNEKFTSAAPTVPVSKSKEPSGDSESETVAAELMLKDVLDLGGTQEDYTMLKQVTDKDDMDVNECAVPLEFDMGELVTFMKSNGLKVPKKEKKKKKEDASVEEKSETAEKIVRCPTVPLHIAPHDKLLFKTNEPWYTNVQTHKSTNMFEGTEKWKSYAQKLWDSEVELSTKLRDQHQSQDQQWMRTVFTGGTLNDKISAHCLLLQESPVHHIKSLEALLALGKKKSKRHSIIAIETLKEIFLSTLLPDNRKLLTFYQHDFTQLSETANNVASNRLVLGWLVEDSIKQLYGQYIDMIKLHLNDNEVPIRTKICNLSYQLLNEKPEREQEILSLVVNKIGDPDKKLASKIIYILGQLLLSHPSMKTVVSSEVERILFRPNISERAQYYAICFLNQLKLSSDDHTFASYLIEIFFKFFKESIDKENVNSRMLGALLTGVNRAYPYITEADNITTDNINTLFKLVYVSNFNVSVQALMLLYQVSGKQDDICDRYYQALYAKLIDPTINSSSKKTFLLNLIYKSLKRDTNLSRQAAIARRLLQVSNLDDPVLACASLYTISSANKDSKTIRQTEASTESGTVEGKIKERTSRSDSYNPANRNPLFASADKLELWEFDLMSKNYHPSVSQFVNSLLSEGSISYEGDPFNDFSQIKFLDKFVFKNPKKDVKVANRNFYSKNKVDSQQPQVYSNEFVQQNANKIHPDEQFFYNYFKTKGKGEVSQPKDDLPVDDDQMLDFVDDIKSAVATKMDKKKKEKTEDMEPGEEDESGSEFSYGEIEDDDFEDDAGLTKANDKVYEKFLWEHLNSDGESIDGEDDQEDEKEENDSDVEFSDIENDDSLEEDEGSWEDIAVESCTDAEDLQDEPTFKVNDQISKVPNKNKKLKDKKRKFEEKKPATEVISRSKKNKISKSKQKSKKMKKG